MHGNPMPGGKQERRDQGLVLVYVTDSYPGLSRLSELTRTLSGDPKDYAERDRIERAVSELVGVGLLFRCEGLVLPTRAALRAYEVLEEDGP